MNIVFTGLLTLVLTVGSISLFGGGSSGMETEGQGGSEIVEIQQLP